MQTISLKWKGEPVEFKPSFDLFMRIEEKVSFNRLADAMNQAGLGNLADLPMSHVSWVLYCCLRQGGVMVRTPDDVHKALFDGGGIEWGGVIAGLMIAYYGAQPQKPPKKKATPRPSSSNPSKAASRNATE